MLIRADRSQNDGTEKGAWASRSYSLRNERHGRDGHATSLPKTLILIFIAAMTAVSTARGLGATEPGEGSITIGVAAAKVIPGTTGDSIEWISSNPKIAQVFPGGWVVGIAPGKALLRSRSEQLNSPAREVIVKQIEQPIVDPASLKQFPDSRHFTVNGRECYGSELNGRRTTSPEEHANTSSNRIINPSPLRPDRRVDWAVKDGCEIFDGAGVLMGTVAPTLEVDGKKRPVSKFNFGMSKVLHGRLCLYAFSISIKPTPQLARMLDPKELENGTVGTSAWLPLDQVLDPAALLERDGVGKVKLPRLPLEKTRYRITGGNPNHYMTPLGEMSIVKDVKSGPVPSHYLRRPSGTVNIIYSVPGFGLGGQGLDSFLVSDGMIFRPAQGAKVFVQPTYYPAKDRRAGQVSPMTETFLYGAVETKGSEPVYGWVAKEALAPVR
jgi:hypothetical protein